MNRITTFFLLRGPLARLMLVVGCAPCAHSCARFGYERLAPRENTGSGVDASVGGASGFSGGIVAVRDASSLPVGEASEGETSDAAAAGLSARDASPGAAVVPDSGLGTCSDGIQNGDERAPDCGGVCAPCFCTYDTPVALGAPNSPGNDLYSPSLTEDGLELFVGVIVPSNPEFVAVAGRGDTADPFGLGNPLPVPVAQLQEGTPHISRNGLSLYFYSTRGGADRDLFHASRATRADAFGSVSTLANLNSSAAEHLPWLSQDELDIYFLSNRLGDWNIYHASRSSVGDSFGAPSEISELNESSSENGVTLSADQRLVLFTSPRSGLGGQDIFRAARATRAEPFSAPVAVPGVSSTAEEVDVALTPDGAYLYFSSNRNSPNYQIWRSKRTCP